MTINSNVTRQDLSSYQNMVDSREFLSISFKGTVYSTMIPAHNMIFNATAFYFLITEGLLHST